MKQITVVSSPFDEDKQDDNPPPWTYDEEGFCSWVHEVFLEGYKNEAPFPSVEEAVALLTERGFKIEVKTKTFSQQFEDLKSFSETDPSEADSQLWNEYTPSLLAAYNKLRKLCQQLLDTEDNTGCTDDLTVVSMSAVEKIRESVTD